MTNLTQDPSCEFDPNEDKIKEECGVFGIFGIDNAASMTALGLHALQHRGQEACGIATSDGDKSFNFEANSKSNWNDAVVEFTNLVNQFLQSEKSEYNIYPANAGNEGLMYILSEQQFSLLNKHIDDRPVRPQNIESWNRIYNTTQEEYRKYIERDEFQFKFGMTMNLKNHGKVKVIKVINDKSAEIQVGDKIGRIDLITGKYRLTFNNDESNQTEQIPKSFAQPEDLKVGMNIKHLKFGKGKIMDITNKGVANIKFEDGEKRIILEYAKLEIVE